MNDSMHLNSTGFSAGTNPAPCYPIQLDPQRPVFSPAVRFAPEELSLSQAAKRAAYWAAIIAIAVGMGRSGFSHLRQVSPERSGHHSIK